jgi:hypothetical protein
MQATEFSYWKRCYDHNELSEFNEDATGLLWLKLKSLARKELLDQFMQANGLAITATTLHGKWEQLFYRLQTNLAPSHQMLDRFIRQTHQQRMSQFDEQALISELYKLKHYDWGGDYKNNLDKHLVDEYIKVHHSFEALTAKLENEILRSVTGYVLCSWYNHWSSILIENLFKSHPAVLPALGQIKKVDFFIGSIPFDLKVTYLPANYIEKKRKQRGLKSELAQLRQAARSQRVSFQQHRKAQDTYYEISQKLQDRNDPASNDVLQSIAGTRKIILMEARANPKELIVNLYEKQGEMRFDAANRLFLILVDTQKYEDSWKLRRNFDLLKPTINNFLDNFSTQDFARSKTNFTYAGRSYQCLADCVFVIR